MFHFLLGIHIVICILLTFTVLIQSAKGGGLGGAFGGVTETAFGNRAGNFLTRLTVVWAVLFMVSCLALAILSPKGSRSIMEKEAAGALAPSSEAPAKEVLGEETLTEEGPDEEIPEEE
jgi:preprotein translocase subunit SecG